MTSSYYEPLIITGSDGSVSNKKDEFSDNLDRIYNQNLGRNAADTGRDYWRGHYDELIGMGQTPKQAYDNITASVQQSSEYQNRAQTTVANPVSAADHTGPWEARWQADERDGSPWDWKPAEEQKQWGNVTGAGDLYKGTDLSHFNSYVHKAFADNFGREPDDEGYAYWSKDMAWQQAQFQQQGLSELDAQKRSYDLMVANMRQSPEYQSRLSEGANRNPYVPEKQPGDPGQQMPIYYGSGGSNTTIVQGPGPKSRTAADLMINPYKEDPNIWAGKNRQGQLTSKQAGSISGVPGQAIGGTGGVNIAGPR